MTAAVIEFLRQLVRSRSVSGDEGECIGIWAAAARQAGLAPVLHGRNVWVERRVNDGPALLFNSHLDTVRPGESWTRDPWSGDLVDGELRGLGANDAKASVAAQLHALLALSAAGFDGNLVVCASCDEETGGEGMEKIARVLPPYDAAVIGEPNDMAVATGQRGLVKGVVRIAGVRAHASRPWQGENAIHRAARVIEAVEAPHLNVPGDLRRATAQVTLIHGGTQSNVIPDLCELTLDCRTTPEFDNEAMLAHLDGAARSANGVLVVKSNRFKPVHTPPNSALVSAALAASGGSATGVFPSVCDLFWVSHVPAIVMGPGRPERSHQADEFVRVDEVMQAVEVYVSLARGWWERVRRRSE